MFIYKHLSTKYPWNVSEGCYCHHVENAQNAHFLPCQLSPSSSLLQQSMYLYMHVYVCVYVCISTHTNFFAAEMK